MKAKLVRKACNLEDNLEIAKRLEIQEDNVEITKVINISRAEFKNLASDFFKDTKIVTNNLDLMRYDDKTKTWHCIAVICSERDIAILIESEGYDYPRYTAIVPKSEVTND